MEPWDVELIRSQPSTSLVGIAREGRLVRDDGRGPVRVDLSWVDESALALIDLAVRRVRNLYLVYPAPAGELPILLAAQLLLHRFVQGARAPLVGLVTADTTLAARTWEGLRIAAPGSRVAISSVFPCYRAGPDGESPLGRRSFQGVLVGRRCLDWRVDLLIEDHLAGPVAGDRRVLTIGVFADPLDPVLARLAEEGELLWGWSGDDLALWNERLETRLDNSVPFSVAHERLVTMAGGVAVTVEMARHPGAELVVKRIWEDLRFLRELAGPMPSRHLAKGLGVAWHHLSTLTSLPCTPSRFDRFAGAPPWAARATGTFEHEIAAWARTLHGDAAEIASVLAGDLGDLRAALDEGNPFERALAEAASQGPETLVVVKTRTAARALLDALGGDPAGDRVGCLRVCAHGRLHRQGTWARAIAVGAPTRWDWHRLDSGVSCDLRVLVLGEEAARVGRSAVAALQEARQRWGGVEVRAATWRALVGGEPPPAPREMSAERPEAIIVPGPEFVAEPDPFDFLVTLLASEPLRVGGEGLEETLAQETDEGAWAAAVAAVEVTTDHGRIKLEAGHPVEVRSGPRIVDRAPEQLEPGMCLLVGRRQGRLGLLEALEERLRHRRPDLLAGRLLIDSYHRTVQTRFREAGLSLVQLQRALAGLGCDKTVHAVRGWVGVQGTLAPREFADLRRLNVALALGLTDRQLAEVFAAVQRRRGFRRAAGRVLAEAARSSTAVTDHSRIDAETGLSVADLREAVVEATVVSVTACPSPVPVTELGRLEAQ